MPLSYASSWLSSYVAPLQLISRYPPKSSNGLGAKDLLLAKSHLSTFTRLKSLTLAAVSFVNFDDELLEVCFGFLAKMVQELKLRMCLLDEERFCAFSRSFTRLESFAINGNVWLSSESSSSTLTISHLKSGPILTSHPLEGFKTYVDVAATISRGQFSCGNNYLHKMPDKSDTP